MRPGWDDTRSITSTDQHSVYVSIFCLLQNKQTLLFQKSLRIFVKSNRLQQTQISSFLFAYYEVINGMGQKWSAVIYSCHRVHGIKSESHLKSYREKMEYSKYSRAHGSVTQPCLGEEHLFLCYYYQIQVLSLLCH